MLCSMKKQLSKVPSYTVSANMQRWFIAVVIGCFIAQEGYITYSIMSSADDQADMFTQFRSYAVYLITPVLTLAITYILNPRRLRRLTRLFESLIITIAGYSIATTVLTILPYTVIDGDSVDNFDFYQLSSSAAFLVLYTIALLAARKRGVWS